MPFKSFVRRAAVLARRTFNDAPASDRFVEFSVTPVLSRIEYYPLSVLLSFSLRVPFRVSSVVRRKRLRVRLVPAFLHFCSSSGISFIPRLFHPRNFFRVRGAPGISASFRAFLALGLTPRGAFASTVESVKRFFLSTLRACFCHGVSFSVGSTSRASNVSTRLDTVRFSASARSLRAANKSSLRRKVINTFFMGPSLFVGTPSILHCKTPGIQPTSVRPL
jgi:hypothetical protein